MKRLLAVLACVFMASCAWCQDAKGFEGAWTGSFIHDNQAPRTWTYVFENIHDNTCTGFFWTGKQHAWTKCEIKDGEIAVYTPAQKPGDPLYLAVTGKIISPTQLELGWHAQNAVHTFVATKQTAEFRKTLVDPTEVAGVDTNHLGIYRALADTIEESVKKNDMVTAARLSRVLEVAWDRAEDDLQKTSRQTWGSIDKAMDDLVLPVIAYKKTPPDPAKVDAAYHAYLEKLKDGQAYLDKAKADAAK